jgi:hypothetical protein
MNGRMPLSPRALRRRAIFLPAVVVLVVWVLNVMALRTHIGPQQSGLWMFVFVAASVFLAWSLWWRAKESGVPPWRTAFTAVGATVGWFLVSGVLPDVSSDPKIKIGDRGTRPGGGFTLNISNEFQRPQLESLLARAQQFGPSGALEEFACGDRVPDFLFELRLRPAKEYNDRLVGVAYTPDLDAGGAQRFM